MGKRREHNEDSYLRDDALGLYLVADGVGGRAKGEVASREAVDAIHNWVLGGRAALRALVATPDDEDAQLKVRRTLEAALQSACYIIFGMAELDPEQRGMSTTASALLVVSRFAFVAQVGDSRVYLLRDGGATQLTEDHTLVNYKVKHGLLTPEQARDAPGKNVITRAVGHRDYVQVDTLHVEVKPGDRFLLCSDGLHGYVDDAPDLVPLIQQKSLSDGAQALVDFANDCGGKDNVTAVLVEVVG